MHILLQNLLVTLISMNSFSFITFFFQPHDEIMIDERLMVPSMGGENYMVDDVFISRRAFHHGRRVGTGIPRVAQSLMILG